MFLFYFFLSCCASSFNPPNSSVVKRWQQTVCVCVCVCVCFLWCLAAPYTRYSVYVCIYVKCQIVVCKCKRKCFCVYVGLVVDSSLHSEAAGLLHSRQQFLVKFLVRLVGRDVYPVKTRDRGGELVIRSLTLQPMLRNQWGAFHLSILTTCEPWAGCLCWHLSNGWWRALVLQNL